MRFQAERSLRVLGFALVIFCSTARAQQEPAFAMHMWNTLAWNPGYAGSAGRMSASLFHRQQWAGLDGAPSTQLLTAHAPLSLEQLAAGFSVSRDDVGPLDDLRISGDFAYRIRTSETMRLAFGVKAGLEWMQMQLAGVANVDPRDPIFQQDRVNSARPNIGFGVYWWSDQGAIGLSAPRLLEYDAIELDATGQQLTGARQLRHYHLTAGRVFKISGDIKLQAWILAKAVEHAPVSMDLTLTILMRDKLWVGGSFRDPNTVAAILAYQFHERFKLGYAYETTLGSLRAQVGGTHEVMLSYELRLWPDQVLSPRFF